jgi:hypothetical protein
MFDAAWVNVTGRGADMRTAKEVSLLKFHGSMCSRCRYGCCVGRQKIAAAKVVCLATCLCLSLSGMQKSR